MLKGKTVLLGVTGSIAAYKIASLASMLVKQHAEVHVIMTKNATNFINPITFESLTKTKCLVDTFDRNFEFKIEHVSIAKKADVMLVAPASANIIAKMTHGIADDMLSTTALAFRGPIIVSPAMNTNMFENPITQDNINILKKYGMTVVEPAVGMLACGDVGAGKMPEPEVLLEYILKSAACKKDLKGKNVLITAGATMEAIDPVRYITNHSTGKMGYALARRAMLRGANVTLISGKTVLNKPMFVDTVDICSAADMYEEVSKRALEQDIIIKAAAVADYTPVTVSDEKIKKNDGSMSIELKRTTDILAYLGSLDKNNRPFICGFSMETSNLIENSQNKLKKKNIDMIVANSLKVKGAGFGTDTNVVTIITNDNINEYPIMDKEEVADNILDAILKEM